MKFNDYMTYLQEANDYSNEIHYKDQNVVSTDALVGHCSYTLEDGLDYNTTKNMVITIEYKVGNLGKKALTFPEAINNDPKSLKLMDKALKTIKKSLDIATKEFDNAIVETFESNGFKFLSKKELATLVKGGATPTPEKEEKKSDEIEDLDDLDSGDELEELE